MPAFSILSGSEELDLLKADSGFISKLNVMSGMVPFVAKSLSESLSANFSSEIPLKSIPIDDLNEDIHASAEYRANLIDVLTKEIIDNY